MNMHSQTHSLSLSFSPYLLFTLFLFSLSNKIVRKSYSNVDVRGCSSQKRSLLSFDSSYYSESSMDKKLTYPPFHQFLFFLPLQDPPFLLSTAPSHPFPLDLRGTGFALPQILQAGAINHTTKLTEQRRWADNVNHNSLLIVSHRHSSVSFVSFSRYAQDFPHF